ncbi:hypothetical protein ACTFIR_005752 [Dictyostelium discoideum]
MGHWKSNDSVDTFYDKRIIGEKSGGFLNTSHSTRPLYHKGNKKLFKARLFLPKKTCWFKGEANRIEGCSLFPSYDYVLTTDASESGAGAAPKKGNKTIKTWSFQWSTTQSNISSNRREMLALLMASVRTTLETIPQEESELDLRTYYRILQCKSRPPQPSFRDESQIIVQSNQELQLATEERSVQSNPTSVRSNSNESVRISPEPSNVQLLNNQNECTPPRLESMEAMSGLPTTHSFAFYPAEDELVQFEEGFYNTDLPNLEISNLVSDYSSSSSSSSSSHVSLKYWGHSKKY